MASNEARVGVVWATPGLMSSQCDVGHCARHDVLDVGLNTAVCRSSSTRGRTKNSSCAVPS